MEQKKITSYQFFSILFLFAVITPLTYSSKLSNTEEIGDFIISILISLILTFVFLIPSYLLYKKFPNNNMFSGKLGKAYIVIYALYFVFLICYMKCIFKILIICVMPPEVPATFITVFAFLGAIYCAKKGIEAIARTIVIIFFFIVVSIIAIGISLLPKIEVQNFSPLFKSGLDEVQKGAIYIVSRNFALPIIAVILPFLSGNAKKVLISYSIFTHAFSASIVFITIGVLGQYLETQLFPVYSCTRIAEIGVFRHLDSIYIGVFTTGGFILVGLLFYILFFVCSKFKKQSIKEISIVLSGIIIILVTIVIPGSNEFSYFIFNKYLILFSTIFTASVLPLIFLIKNLIIENRRKKNEKSILYSN